MNKNNEKAWERLASRYIEHEGQRLKEEVEDCEKITYDFEKLDQRVERGKRQKMYRKPLGLIAAVVLLLFVPTWLKSTQDSPEFDFEYNNTANSPMIPLAFTLPENLEVVKAEQDLGQTIYYLDNDTSDDIVLSVEKEEGAVAREGLRELETESTPIYYLSCADYKLIQVTKDGLLYTITCKYEMDSILLLAEEILES